MMIDALSREQLLERYHSIRKQIDRLLFEDNFYIDDLVSERNKARKKLEEMDGTATPGTGKEIHREKAVL